MARVDQPERLVCGARMPFRTSTPEDLLARGPSELVRSVTNMVFNGDGRRPLPWASRRPGRQTITISAPMGPQQRRLGRHTKGVLECIGLYHSLRPEHGLRPVWEPCSMMEALPCKC